MYKEDWQEVAKVCEQNIRQAEKDKEINEVMRDQAKKQIDMAKPRPVLPKVRNGIAG